MQLDNLLGNAENLAPLKTALKSGSLAHAVLLAAPDGCGRNFAARCLAADYLFPAGGPGASAVLLGQSSEVLLVAGEGKSGQIPVDRIRAVRSDVFLSSLSAAGRVVHIRDAHHMAAPAANALLKVLEEPPADVLFILTAQSPAALPATILSRCALYTLVPAGLEATVRLAGEKPSAGAASAPSAGAASAPGAGADPNLPALLAALYDGRAGLALRALASEERLATVQDALAAARCAASRDSYGLLAIFAGYEGRAEGDRERRDALLADMTDALSAAMRGKTASGLPQLPPAAAALLLPPLAEARMALAGNAAPKIAFTALAVRLSRAGQR